MLVNHAPGLLTETPNLAVMWNCEIGCHMPCIEARRTSGRGTGRSVLSSKAWSIHSKKANQDLGLLVAAGETKIKRSGGCQFAVRSPQSTETIWR